MSPLTKLCLTALCLSYSSSKFVSSPSSARSPHTWERVYRVLADHPVLDGHNDFPMGVRSLLNNDVWGSLHFDQDLTQQEPWASYWANHCDLPRMR